MVTNLFSVFDPSATLTSNWVSMIIILMILPQWFWKLKAKATTPFSMFHKTLFAEYKNLLTSSKTLGLLNIFLAMFFLILLNNITGMFSYTLTTTSHLSVSLSLSIPIWLSLMMFGWLNHTSHMLTHLVPQSTPPGLMPFMVLIETTSNIIRPLTLAVRLSANMIAGHLLMTLLGNQMVHNSSMVAWPLILATQLILLTLESAVAMIQAYVFTILATLYANEIIFAN